MKKLLLSLALILAPSFASAQCTGVFPPSTLCGNPGVTPKPPSIFSVGSLTFNNTTGNNLIRNAGLGLTTEVSTVLVGNRIQITSYAQQGGAGSGNVRFTTSGGNAGLQPGKLVAILGNNTASISATCTATLGNTLTCPPGTFSQSQGDLIWITGGNNTSPRTQYYVNSFVGTTAVTVGGGLINEAAKTYTILAIQGSYSVDATLNGLPAAGNPFAPAFFYYPLQVTAVGAGWFDAQMAGRNLNVGATAAVAAWETTNGNQGTGFIPPDWWTGTFTLSCYKMRGIDWDGTTVVNKPGALYSTKCVKGVAGAEVFVQDMTASNPAFTNIPNPAGSALFQGKSVLCGAYIKTPNANQGRVFIYDGITQTFGSFITPGSLQWVEVSATLSNSLTTAQFGLSLDAGSVGDTFIFTQPICVFGSGIIGAGNYRPGTPALHMFTNHNNPFYFINQAVPLSTYINIEQETNGLLPSGLEYIQSDIGGRNSSALSFIYLADGPGPPQMSAIVCFNQVLAAVDVNCTGSVGVSRGAAGDGLGFFQDRQYIKVGDPNWENVTVDYLGAFY